MPRSPSLRSLGQQLNLSTTTVSLALRQDPRIKPATRLRVERAARAAGYQTNPAVHSIMSAMRRSAHHGFRGALLAVNYREGAQTELATYHHEVLSGARARAHELGYSLEHTWVGTRQMNLKRLDAIIAARGVQGLIIMPFAEIQDFSGLNWANISSVVMDYCLSQPALHTVLPDHHLSLLTAMRKLHERGYRRPGFVMDAQRDARLKHKWSAGFISSFREQEITPPVPPLLASPITRENFLTWFKRHQPDVIIGHLQQEITTWLKTIGASIPKDVGFLQLNWTERTSPCAGVDQQPALLGGAAVEALIAQITRNEHGVPIHPKTITIEGRWVEGPTLRAG